MKQFLTKIFLFITPAIVACVLIFLYYLNIKNTVHTELQRIANFECLILGDSQMQRLIPDAFSCTTYNFASSGEHYYFTYQKLKKILSIKNHQIEKIILGVSLHNFAPVYNRLFDLRFSEGKRSLNRFLYFIDLDDRTFIKRKELFTKDLLRGIFQKTDWGGFYESDKENPDSATIMKTFNMHYMIKTSEDKYAMEQKEYLYLIDSLCKSNKIDLYYITTPYHPMYLNQVDSSYTSNLKSVINNLGTINYINYLYTAIDPFLMSDANHLNTKGAELYSKKINEMISY